MRPGARVRLVVATVLLLLCAALAYPRLARPRIHIEQLAHDLPADGRSHQLAILATRFHLPLTPEDLRVTGTSSELHPLSSSRISVDIRNAVNPGVLHLTVAGPRNSLLLTSLTHLDTTDSFADGTPDFLRLHAEDDRYAFRSWFTTLAERVADLPDAQLARDLPEITDCASLLRYAYRESLRRHDSTWYAHFGNVESPLLPTQLRSVVQWTYPHTPLGAALFRVRPGPFVSADLTNGAFAQFADAKTLYTLNAYRVSRDISAARAGDLIFYRVLESDSQYHSMIFTGTKAEWVVYHTGPIDKHRGEMRRVLLADLLRHPDPRWRPVRSNPNFLGVFRWNILREE